MLASVFAILATVIGVLAVIDELDAIATVVGHMGLINAIPIPVDTILAASETAVVLLLK